MQSQDNPKNKLLVKIAKFKGGKCQPKFADRERPGPVFSSAVTVTLSLNDQEKSWTVETKEIYSTKKAAQFEACRLLMNTAEFNYYLLEQNWPVQTQVAYLNAGFASLSICDLSQSSANLSLANTNQHDQKGWLIEKLREVTPRRDARFSTTTVAPFISTVVIPMQPEAADITVRGHACSTKKGAEQSAATMALQDPRLLLLFGLQVPDRRADTQSKNVISSTNQLAKRIACCAVCKAKYEPQRAATAATGCKRGLDESVATEAPSPVQREEQRVTAEMKEQEQEEDLMCRYCGKPVSRATSNGTGTRPYLLAAVTLNSAPALSPRPNDTLAVVYPFIEGDDCETSPHFQVTDLLSPDCISSGKVPRPEQLRAFQLCLQAHQIVVFPTGHGKTFVASLVMHRFRRLNPRKLVLMVVDRVPLVQQQSQAIHRDTGLAVCALSGENNAKPALLALRAGKYAALVITAGALCNFLWQDELRVTNFSVIVFDECHHVTKEHPYVKVLQEIAKVETYLQPRVVGLSASPISADSVEKAVTKLRILTRCMLGAGVYRPVSGAPVMEGVSFLAVSLNGAQQAAIAQLLRRLVAPVEYLFTYFRVNKPLVHRTIFGEDPANAAYGGHKYSWARAMNLASETHLLPTDPLQVHETAAKIREIVEGLQTASLLGPAFVPPEGAVMSTPEIIAAASAICDRDPTAMSSQLERLCKVLVKYGSTACTLVFVEMRHTAEMLCSFLQLQFPALNCAKLIGQGGAEGMKWRGVEGQAAVLEQFRAGTSKLIVCTSVLEEGLDVKGCDLVIRFGGSPSLIQLVQSKGRARDKDGRLLLICTHEERGHFDKLVEQEAFVDEAMAAYEDMESGVLQDIEDELSSLTI